MVKSTSMLFVLVVMLGLMVRNVAATELDEEKDRNVLEAWQQTYLYLAPTSNGKGWGVFAAKPFRKGDVVEVAPMWVGFESHEAVLGETIFEDYHIERWEWDGSDHQSKAAYTLGPSHMFNSGPEEQQNVQLEQFGDEDYVGFGLSATRDIAVGEELLGNYGSEWFTKRGMYPVLVDDTENDTTMKAATPLLIDDEWRDLYTSKIYTGCGRQNCPALTTTDRFDMDSFIETRLSPLEAGYRNARAKVSIDEAGTLLEIAPAHVMDKETILNTLLEPLVVFWNDIEPSSLMLQAENDNFPETVQVLYKDSETDWSRQYMELKRVEESVLLPLGGGLSMLERTTSEDPDDYNCRLEGITPDRWNDHAFTIRVVSTKPIAVGERLVLKMAGISSSPETRHALWQQLVATDQPDTPADVNLTEDEFDMDDYDEDTDNGDDYDVNQTAEF
jgi:hypothetical protein